MTDTGDGTGRQPDDDITEVVPAAAVPPTEALPVYQETERPTAPIAGSPVAPPPPAATPPPVPVGPGGPRSWGSGWLVLLGLLAVAVVVLLTLVAAGTFKHDSTPTTPGTTVSSAVTTTSVAPSTTTSTAKPTTTSAVATTTTEPATTSTTGELTTTTFVKDLGTTTTIP